MASLEQHGEQPDRSSRRRQRSGRTSFLLGAVATIIVVVLVVGVFA